MSRSPPPGTARRCPAPHRSRRALRSTRGPERHVRAGSEVARAAGIEGIQRHGAVANPIEPAAETAATLEYDLRLGLELQGQDLAGERRGVAIRRIRCTQPGEPSFIHDTLLELASDASASPSAGPSDGASGAPATPAPSGDGSGSSTSGDNTLLIVGLIAVVVAVVGGLVLSRRRKAAEEDE